MSHAKTSDTSRPHQQEVDIAIIGGGITGLATAYLLHKAGHQVLLLEARNELGGRIRSVRDETTNKYLGDLGPTWVWPLYQPTVARWLARLKLETFEQFEDGLDVIEMSPGSPPLMDNLPEQTGSMRLCGGTQAFISSLAAALPTDIVKTGATVTAISKSADAVMITLDGIPDRTIRADTVICATPPRITTNTISWSPSLPKTLLRALNDLPTWMAPQAKAVLLFDRPFWRERGLSGRVASRIGPLMEIHDHCSDDGKTAALFGFVGWPHDVRAKLGPALKDRIVEQLVRCFGADAPAPTSIQIMDRAQDPLVANTSDLTQAAGHPHIGPEIIRQPHYDGKIWFAVAETARQSPGLIDGALIAAEGIAAEIDEPG